MLGVRRPTVTLAAGMLQKAGLIHYSRGVVTILDRAGLEQVSCECHRVSRNEYGSGTGIVQEIRLGAGWIR
jgi:Mn-dependent DtxR family transcriptional regulator